MVKSKSVQWVEKDPQKEMWWPSAELKKKAWVSSSSIYKKDPQKFWAEQAKELHWFQPWQKIYQEKIPYFQWFLQGKINASYNCLDRHLEKNKDKTAIIWEPEIGDTQTLTYQQLSQEVSLFANVLKKIGVKKGDFVTIYLPMIPETVIAMQACSRIGAPHSVVFSAFSPDSLKQRIQDAQSKFLITCDGYYRRGKIINLKEKADQAISNQTKTLVINRASLKIKLKKNQFWWHELKKQVPSECPPEPMDSEDILFILYTSGTTGQPKGIIHTHGGYLTYAATTTKINFDLHKEDIFWCTADVGWITGHTYICYGPLLNAGTIVIYEGSPDYPDFSRWWQIIEKHQITIFYTAPTAIRMFVKAGISWIQKHNLDSLRLLGTVGEPINREAWLWFFRYIGQEHCPVIDTWWQTETGGHMINTLPGLGPFIPTVAGLSFPGTQHEIVDEDCQPAQEGYLIQKSPFAPGMLRGVLNNPQRYQETYWGKYKKYYYTSDGAVKFQKKYFRITGRTDDIMKIAGHRLATAELENAVTEHSQVVECAVVPLPDNIRGEVPLAFVIAQKPESEQFKKEIIKQVEKSIGPIARPKFIIFVDDLPKTRSGKIMRRVLKNIIQKKPLGNLSTLQNPDSVGKIKKIITNILQIQKV
ncbi:acetate--CoA ligase [Candidatus Woesearchaeota archaeon]|nr:acetate--CoA ligase [Candidatus Woesearchaeota archaeon]